MVAEQLLDIIDTYLEQSVARPTVTADQAIRAVRELEVELGRLSADAALGALVRSAPKRSALYHYGAPDAFEVMVSGTRYGEYPTPEEAIRAATETSHE